MAHGLINYHDPTKVVSVVVVLSGEGAAAAAGAGARGGVERKQTVG